MTSKSRHGFPVLDKNKDLRETLSRNQFKRSVISVIRSVTVMSDFHNFENFGFFNNQQEALLPKKINTIFEFSKAGTSKNYVRCYRYMYKISCGYLEK